ncbi:MAG: beta strand repeat-containing protein, partial [Crocinitomicaceae bacterium]
MKRLITLTTALAFSLLSMATVQTVTNSNDTGAGSLREEITNALAGDTIRFSSSIIASGSATISLQGEIAFSKNLTIVGLYNSTDTLYLSGGGNNRIFNITNASTVFLDSVVLVNGFSSQNGGAISFELSDSLFISNSVISNNVANRGAGIYSNYSSTSSSNTASFVSINNSTLNNNAASVAGGAVYSYSLSFAPASSTASSIVKVTNSTINGNTANNGAGIFADCYAFTSSGSSTATPFTSITITTSTLSNNMAQTNGGGLFLNSYSSTNASNTNASVVNSTFYKNSASVDGNSINLENNTSALTIKGSIVHSDGNTTSNIYYDQTLNTFTTQGYNIFSDSLNEVFAATDQLSIDNATLNLDILQNNGGTTLTHLPLSGSVALNAGDPSDLSDAQNKQIVGVREIGSTAYCSTTGTDTQVACVTYTWIDGNTYTTDNNTATFNVVTAQGCDSLVTLDLTINNPNTGTDVQVACDTYTWIDGNTYTASNNVATHILTNINGCDSVVTLDLTVNYSSTGTDTQTACDSYTWIDGNTYTTSNSTATHILTNSVGCDSVITLNLIINNSSTGTDTQIACNTYTWIDGNTYTSSNTTATQVLTNSAGCDSIVTLNLTINTSNTGIDTQIACGPFTWIDGNTYSVSNNTASFTLTNAAGCDSVVTLDLTVNSPTSGTDTQMACDSYTWIDGITYTANNNMATFTLTNAAGCDSVVSLNLTINNSSSGTDLQTACETYTWIDGNTYTANNTTATHVLTNAAGCDSTVTLNLTINNSSTGTDTQMACDSFTWIDGNTYSSDNNTATFTLTNAAGCDSVVTLDLTVTAVDITTTLTDVITIMANQTG